MKRKRAIVISPTPECLCMAALSRSFWDFLEPAGAKLIVDVLKRLKKRTDNEEAIFIVPRVEDPEKVGSLLAGLVGRGVKIRWFAPESSLSVSQACEGVPSVTLIQGENLLQAFEKGFPDSKIGPALLSALRDNDSDLTTYLRYKISLFLMRLLDPEPLREAAILLADHIAKPFRLDILPEEDQRAVEGFRDAEFPFLEGRSRAILTLKKRILNVAPSEMSVIILGETGTGKEAVAYYLHEFSERRAKPFVVLNCAGLDENFLRSELFGHKQGAFTGAISDKSGLVKLVDGGTLFLDEVGEMSPSVQADLLRFLQTRRFRMLGGTKVHKTDIRLISATQPGLKEKIKEGVFREDLYFRIAEVVIQTPALADVPEDVFRMARHYIYRLNKKENSNFDVDDVLDYFEKNLQMLERHPWVGNVRELIALVKRRIRLGDDVINELNPGPKLKKGKRALFEPDCFRVDALRTIDAVVAEYVRGAYAARGGLTQRELAARLGKSLNTIKKILGEESGK